MITWTILWYQSADCRMESADYHSDENHKSRYSEGWNIVSRVFFLSNLGKLVMQKFTEGFFRPCQSTKGWYNIIIASSVYHPVSNFGWVG